MKEYRYRSSNDQDEWLVGESIFKVPEYIVEDLADHYYETCEGNEAPWDYFPMEMEVEGLGKFNIEHEFTNKFMVSKNEKHSSIT